MLEEVTLTEKKKLCEAEVGVGLKTQLTQLKDPAPGYGYGTPF